MKRYVIIFYTRDPKPAEHYTNHTDDMVKMIARIRELTQKKALFTVWELGECVGDFS